jgi:hypothetical protein
MLFTFSEPVGGRMLGWIVCLAVVATLGRCEAEVPTSDELASMIKRGEQFLVNMFDPTIELLPEFPGSKTYWLYHDNYLAAKMLERVDADLAQRIRAKIRSMGVESSGKIEILFGETGQSSGPPRFWRFDLSVVKDVGDKVIKTERVTNREMKGWQEYADLLAMRVIGEPGDAEGKESFAKLKEKWDGHGLADPATKAHQLYATYKLALALIASQRMGEKLSFEGDLLSRLKSQQAPSGGWITDYDESGKSHGFANVETTSMVLLALRGQSER